MTRKPKVKETAEDQAVTDKAMENSGARLLGIVEGLEGLAARMDVLKKDRKQRIAAAKSEGFEPKAIAQLIKRRAMTPEQKEAQGELLLVVETYEAATLLAEFGAARAGLE